MRLPGMGSSRLRLPLQEQGLLPQPTLLPVWMAVLSCGSSFWAWPSQLLCSGCLQA